MRKVIFGINISLDGCCDHTKFIPDEEILKYFTSLLKDVDVLVYGRKTYELMVPYWPDIALNESGDAVGENEYAKAFDIIPKIIVFSETLETADGKTQIVRNNLRETILSLKQEPGKNISIGGVNVPSQLMALGLVDEFHFVIHPIIAGEGIRLLNGITKPENSRLKLVGSKVFSSGCVALHYVKE